VFGNQLLTLHCGTYSNMATCSYLALFPGPTTHKQKLEKGGGNHMYINVGWRVVQAFWARWEEPTHHSYPTWQSSST